MGRDPAKFMHPAIYIGLFISTKGAEGCVQWLLRYQITNKDKFWVLEGYVTFFGSLVRRQLVSTGLGDPFAYTCIILLYQESIGMKNDRV